MKISICRRQHSHVWSHGVGHTTLPPLNTHTRTAMPQATQTTSNIRVPPPLSTVIRPRVFIDRHVSPSVRSPFARQRERGRERERVQSCSPKLSRLASLISMWLIGITIRMRIRIPITFRVSIWIRIRIPIVIVIVLSTPKRLAVCYLWQSLSGKIVANTWETWGESIGNGNKSKRQNTVSITLPWVTQSRLIDRNWKFLELFEWLPQFIAYFCESPLAPIRQIRGVATGGGCTFDWSLLPAISESIKSCATPWREAGGGAAADAVELRLNECQALSGFNTFAWEKHSTGSA